MIANQLDTSAPPEIPNTPETPETPQIPKKEPASARKLASSRANGAKSKGPVTPEGKTRSSRNALRHGLAAEVVVMDNEDDGQYDARLEAYLQTFQPSNIVEFDLVEELAAAKWNQRRALGMQAALLDIHAAKQRSGLAEEYVELSVAARSAFSIEHSVDRNHTFHLLVRYESHHSHQYIRSLSTLLKLRNQAPIEERNEPNPESERPKSQSAPAVEAPTDLQPALNPAGPPPIENQPRAKRHDWSNSQESLANAPTHDGGKRTTDHHLRPKPS